jgi:hypothetical protein
VAAPKGIAKVDDVKGIAKVDDVSASRPWSATAAHSHPPACLCGCVRR